MLVFHENYHNLLKWRKNMDKKNEIKLGDRVCDKVTGYEGIAVARTQFLNGCVQYTIARKLKKGEDINITGDPSIDESVLKVIQKRVITSKEYEEEDKRLGGETKIMRRMRGY